LLENSLKLPSAFYNQPMRHGLPNRDTPGTSVDGDR
jgi:hypothetical protein